MAKTNKEQDETFKTRRRVLKSLGAIPVVYTLSNSSALALASSHQCIANTLAESQPDCVKISTSPVEPDNKWIWHQAKNSNGIPKRWCVAYAEENADLKSYTVTGYDWRFTRNNGTKAHRFIDQNGQTLNSHFGNPLTASCATSFI